MSENQIELFILDRDPIFRLGLCTALADYAEFSVSLVAETTEDIFASLDRVIIPEILILGWSYDDSESGSCWQLCQQLLERSPELIILLLASGLKAQELEKIQGLGVRGYCLKGTNIDTLVFALNCIRSGEIYWQGNHSSVAVEQNLWQKALSSFSNSGKQEISQDIQAIENRLADNSLPTLNRLLLLGRKRELKAAHWLVAHLSGNTQNVPTDTSKSPKVLPKAQELQLSTIPQFEIVLGDPDSVVSRIFNRVSKDISVGLFNSTQLWLEIDILQPRKKQELFYIILETLATSLQDLDREHELALQIRVSLRNIWAQSAIQFFFDNYENSIEIDKVEFKKLLVQNYLTFQDNTYNKIYFAPELLTYLAWEYPLTIERVTYRVDSPEAIARAVNLLHNLTIQIANGIMQLILNNFSDLEIFKYKLYLNNYRSSRAIAHFRNEISWGYRSEKYWLIPKNIFESSYQILTVSQGQIINLSIYAPRTEELSRLRGLSWLTTMILELRDAIAPRLRSVLGLLGNSLVFTLTQIIGKGIGLIGKGIIQGLGSAVRDTKSSNKN